MAKLNELEGRLSSIEANLTEAQTEIVAEIATLRNELANTEIPPAAAASLDRLDTKSRALADVVPNTPPTEPPTPTP